MCNQPDPIISVNFVEHILRSFSLTWHIFMCWILQFTRGRIYCLTYRCTHMSTKCANAFDIDNVVKNAPTCAEHRLDKFSGQTCFKCHVKHDTMKPQESRACRTERMAHYIVYNIRREAAFVWYIHVTLVLMCDDVGCWFATITKERFDKSADKILIW